MSIIGNIANSTEWFKEKVKNYHGDKVEILSEYLGLDKPIDIVYHCKKHGDTYKTINAKNICKSYFLPCKQCQSINKSNSSPRQTKDKEFYFNRLKDYCKSHGGEVVSDKWITAKTVYKFKCGNPNHPIFETTADALYSGSHWCPYCSGRAGNFEDEIREIIESKNGELLTAYENQYSYVKVRCKEHNYIWNIMPLNIKKGRWCPICHLPFSEKVMWDYLTNHGFNVEIQYKFDDLIGENNEKLKFDFAILDKNNKLQYLIEIDDCEHRYNHKQPRRVKARQRDLKKNEYCKIHNIPLYRMQYWWNKEPITYEDYYRYINNQLNFIINKIA